MYGAILGDIIGSRFEFDRGGWTKDFELFTPKCGFTDDTVMTVAVAEALLEAGEDADVSEIEKACIGSMQKWGRKYPNAGYGGRFIGWLFDDNPKPYNSWGNGSAMRVVAAGWLYDTIERTREVARATANVSHNHPEGLKGAECTAAVIFMARKGSSKEEIREYVLTEFGYNLSKGVDELRPLHKHDESCMDSLPKALVSFFEGDSLEDVIRNAVSLGGDTDTIAAIAGAMAEGMYGVSEELKNECLNRLPDEMIDVINSFSDAAQNASEQISADDFEDTVILAGDPFPDKSIEDARRLASKIKSAEELIGLYAAVSNKFFYVEDTEYDYEEGTEEYREVCEEVDSWGELMDDLENRVIQQAKDEELYIDDETKGSADCLEPVMRKYGFMDGSGWWIPIETEE